MPANPDPSAELAKLLDNLNRVSHRPSGHLDRINANSEFASKAPAFIFLLESQRDEAQRKVQELREEHSKTLMSLHEVMTEAGTLTLKADSLFLALEGIMAIGKRDMSNPKYDGYFSEARRVIKEHAS